MLYEFITRVTDGSTKSLYDSIEIKAEPAYGDDICILSIFPISICAFAQAILMLSKYSTNDLNLIGSKIKAIIPSSSDGNH